MKKFISLLLVTAMATTVSFAQDANSLDKEQYKADKILLKLMDVKPTSSAKKEAKRFEKEGWLVPAGEADIATQLTKSQIYATELMRDEAGFTTRRYIQSTAIAKGKSYNAAYKTAVENAKASIVTSLQTEIVAAMQLAIDNEAVSATSIEKFNMKSSAIANSTLSNTMPSVVIYRRLEDKIIESQVRVVFDKMELIARMKRELLKQLEIDAKHVNEIVDNAVRNL